MSPPKRPPKSPAARSAKTTTSKKASGRKAAKPKTTGRKATTSKTGSTGAGKTTARKPAAKKTVSKSSGSSSKANSKAKKSTARKKTTARKPARSRATRSPEARTSRSTRTSRQKFDKKALAAIRTTLQQQLADFRSRQSELEQASFTGTQSDLTGEVGLDEDFADAGTATFERERDLSIRNNIDDLIDQVQRALDRIDEGTYGLCERCGRPIDPARLKALPHALLCMNCKRREERAR